MSGDFDRTVLMIPCRMRFTVRRDDYMHIYHEREDGGFWSHAKGAKCEECSVEPDAIITASPLDA